MGAKILQVNLHGDFGGGEKVMYDLTKNLPKDFTIEVLSGKGWFGDRYKELGVKTDYFTSNFLFKNFFKIFKKIKLGKYDIVHVHGIRTAFLVKFCFIFLKKKIKLVYTLHGLHLTKYHGFKRILISFERLLNKTVNKLVCVSESDKQEVLKYNLIQKEKIKVINNGIDINNFLDSNEYQIEKLQQEFKTNKNFLILSIGRLHQPKDYQTVLLAVKELVKASKKIKYLIVGDGPLRKDLEKKILELELEDTVKILGFREDIKELIKISDVVVFSSFWEGFPLVPLEAGACAKPVVASDISGVKEQIINKKTGFLFPTKDWEKLVDKLELLIKDEGLRLKMGKDAFQNIKENFSLDNFIAKYEKLYNSLYENTTN